MDINPHIFREFSIRGIADRDLTNDVVGQIGRATGEFFRRENHTTLVVGRDIRLTSERISRALIGGLLSAGLDVIDIGTVPTPVLNFSTDHHAAGGGIMITASHNPPDYNGLKIRAQQTLQGDDLQEILRLARSQPAKPSRAGSLSSVDPMPPYIRCLKQLADPGETPLKIVVDGGNGANGLLVPSLLADLGHDVIELNCRPDGSFPNRSPDPTAAGATEALARMVVTEGAHLGIAYDGDGDRMVAVDDQGQTILGDQLLMLLARDVLRQQPSRIVYEILCTQALADDIADWGGIPIMTPSGYAFVHQAMRDTGAAVGGELSGHFFFNETHFNFDDAILASVKLLNILIRDRRPLSTLVGELPAYHSSPELRLPCPDATKGKVVERAREFYRGRYEVEEIDGARIHFPNGWALVRQSNTQPVISTRFEARTARELSTIQDEVLALVKSLITRETIE